MPGATSAVTLPSSYATYRLYDGSTYTVLPEGLALETMLPGNPATKVERAPFSSVIIRTDPNYLREPAPLVLKGRIVNGGLDVVETPVFLRQSLAVAIRLEDFRRNTRIAIKGGQVSAKEVAFGVMDLTLYLYPTEATWRDADGNAVIY